jgi:uncharacterized protein YdaU (DUF1376 family)
MPRRAERSSAKKTPPAFQFYPGDWLASTLGMAWDLKGIYVDFICWSWENGALPDDPAWRQRMIGGSAQSVAQRWAALRGRWRKTAKGWINPRLERQRQIQKHFSDRGKKGAAARWDGDLASRKHASKHRAKHVVSIEEALTKQLQDRWPSSSSSSSDQDQPAPQAPVYTPPFKVFCAIAAHAIDEAQTADLGAIAEAFKSDCARQRIPYDVEITRKAIDAVIRRGAGGVMTDDLSACRTGTERGSIAVPVVRPSVDRGH